MQTLRKRKASATGGTPHAHADTASKKNDHASLSDKVDDHIMHGHASADIIHRKNIDGIIHEFFITLKEQNLILPRIPSKRNTRGSRVHQSPRVLMKVDSIIHRATITELKSLITKEVKEKFNVGRNDSVKVGNPQWICALEASKRKNRL